MSPMNIWVLSNFWLLQSVAIWIIFLMTCLFAFEFLKNCRLFIFKNLLKISAILVIHLELIFRFAVRQGLITFLVHGYSIIPAPFIEQIVLFLLLCNIIFIINQVSTYAWVCFKTLFCSTKLIFA